MSLDADAIVERRRLKRQLTLWRIGAILAIVIVFVWLVLPRGDDGMGAAIGLGSQIARIQVSGLITDDAGQQKLLRKLARTNSVKAVIVHIDSPGGTTAGGEGLYREIRQLAGKKPVVAVFGTVAASAAYMTGIATDHIVARANSITGSVGVILQWTQVTGLLDKVGIQMETIKSGPLKAVPSPFEPTTEEARAVATNVLENSFKWFLDLVKKRRKLSPEIVDQIKSGRIYTGDQAIKIGLIDEIGDERTARLWLAKTHNIAMGTRIRDWRPEGRDRYRWLFGSASAFASLIGIPARFIGRVFGEAGLAGTNTPGLFSIWQPTQ